MAEAIQTSLLIGIVVGFIDGTHIRLPGGDTDYFNRKMYPSIQLQIAVNHRLLLWAGQDASMTPGFFRNWMKKLEIG